MNHKSLLLSMGGLTLVALPLVACSTHQYTPTPGVKRVLLVIQKDFNAAEYGEPRTILEEKGSIVTGNGPDASHLFGKAIAAALEE